MVSVGLAGQAYCKGLGSCWSKSWIEENNRVDKRERRIDGDEREHQAGIAW